MALNPPESDTFKQALRNFRTKGIPIAPKWSIAVSAALLVAFCYVGTQVAGGAPWTVQLNEVMSGAIQGSRSPELNVLIVPLTTLGDLAPMGALGLLTVVVLAVKKHWDDALFITGNAIAGVLVVQILKRLFAVSRPEADALVALPASFSFPSAHTSCSLIVLGLIALVVVRWMRSQDASAPAQAAVFILFLFVAVCIGLSRIYVGVHWPTDVLGGWLFGAAWLVPTVAWYLGQYPPCRFVVGAKHARCDI